MNATICKSKQKVQSSLLQYDGKKIQLLPHITLATKATLVLHGLNNQTRLHRQIGIGIRLAIYPRLPSLKGPNINKVGK
jgi:hypothetical protein